MKRKTLFTSLLFYCWLLLLVSSLLFFSFRLAFAAPSSNPTENQQANWLAAVPTPTRTVVPATGRISIARTLTVTKPIPARLIIPALNIDTIIEGVTRTPTGEMAIPKKAGQVAWFSPGAAPGEAGNAVLAGHLDQADGSPAVFWKLGSLKAGDEIMVVSAEGKEFRFVVTRLQSYAYNKAPLAEIFGFTLRSQLNLITCNGQWNRGTRNYSKRLVVYAELITD